MSTARMTDVDWSKPLLRNGAIAVGLCLGLYWLVQWWQYPPAIEFDNLKYIQLLRTSVSSERPDWVAKVKQAIDERTAAGQMSEQERSHFDRIIALAESKAWAEAHQLCFQFEEAQLNRRRRLPATAEHDHPHH